MLTCCYGQATVERTLYAASQSLASEGEIYLPEDSPELEAVLSAHGYLAEVSGEINGDKLLLSGMVETHLVYRSKEELDQVSAYGLILSGSNGAVFNGEISLPDLVDASWDWQARLVKLKLEPGVAQTVKYRLELEVQLFAGQFKQIDFVDEIQAEAEIQTEVEHLMIAEPILKTYVKREISQQFALTYPKQPLARLLSCQVYPMNSTAVFAKDRVNIEGKMEVELVYVTLSAEGQEGGVETQKWTVENGGAIPFQITAETPVLLEPSVDYELWVEGVQFTSTHPESCRIQVQLGVGVSLSKLRQVKTVIDVSTEGEGIIDLKQEKTTWVEVVEDAERLITVEKMLTLPASYPDIEKVLQVSMLEPTLEWQLAPDQLIVTGEMVGFLLYQTEAMEAENATLQTATWGVGDTAALTFGTALELPGVEKEMHTRCWVNLRQYKSEQVDERTVKLTLEYKTRIRVTQTREFTLVIDSALVLPDEKPKPSMLFYVVQPGDTLWEIARRYNSTMVTIAAANNITNPDHEVVFGRKLLIPKELRAK
jgi:LysM repeat protein